jgi:hypothetical protein
MTFATSPKQVSRAHASEASEWGFRDGVGSGGALVSKMKTSKANGKQIRRVERVSPVSCMQDEPQ